MPRVSNNFEELGELVNPADFSALPPRMGHRKTARLEPCALGLSLLLISSGNDKMTKKYNKTLTININLNFKGLPKFGHDGPPRFNPFGPSRLPFGFRMGPEDPAFDDSIPFIWEHPEFEEE